MGSNKIITHSIVLSPIGLSKAKATCVYFRITVVDSIALGPADGASFCLLPELLALHICTVLLLPPQRLFYSSTSLRSSCRLYSMSSFSLHTCQEASVGKSNPGRLGWINCRDETIRSLRDCVAGEMG